MSRTGTKGLLVSTALIGLMVVVSDGCSGDNGNNNGDAMSDAGMDEPTHPVKRFDAAGTDDGSGGSEAGADGITFGDGGGGPYDGTTGKPCSTDAECSPKGLGLNVCSSSIPWVDANNNPVGPVYPNAVCLPKGSCGPYTDNQIHFCDGPDLPTSPGVCIVADPATGQGECKPKCFAPAGGGPPNPACIGKDACFRLAFVMLAVNGPVTAVGFCDAACGADADCPAPSKCQKDTGTCVNATMTPSQGLGGACSLNDPVGTCNCFINSRTGIGYCSQNCVVGDPSRSCPAGYVCDAGLPMTLIDSTTDASIQGFAAQNQGLGGFCLQVCSLNDAGTAPVDAAGDGAGSADGASDAAVEASAPTPATCPPTATCQAKSAAGVDCHP
jgi:hypothetical protein